MVFQLYISINFIQQQIPCQVVYIRFNVVFLQDFLYRSEIVLEYRNASIYRMIYKESEIPILEILNVKWCRMMQTCLIRILIVSKIQVLKDCLFTIMCKVAGVKIIQNEHY